MKKILIITAIIATGLSTHAQTLVLSDNFDTGGVATNDLNYNLAARQAGILATTGWNHPTNASSLTASGKIEMASYDWAAGLDWISVNDNLMDDLSGNNFSFSMDGKMTAAPANEWMSMYMQSATSGGANFSVMGFLCWIDGSFQIFYGKAETGVASDIASLSAATISEYIPGFSVTAEHNYEFEAFAQSPSNGFFNFKIDGITFLAGLPYDFVDTVSRTAAWISPGGCVSEWDNLDISLIPGDVGAPYVFFDNYNAADADNANAGYITRQSNGLVLATYNDPAAHEIVDGRLNIYQGNPPHFANLGADFAPFIVGEDFEFSIEVSENNMGGAGDWFDLYMVDGTIDAPPNDDARVSTRFGLGFNVNDPAVNPWSFSISYGTGPAREQDFIFLNHYKGDFSKQTDSFALKLVSTAGTGGTNTVEIYVSFDGGTNFIEVTDGVTESHNKGGPIPDFYTYYFDGPERKLNMVGIFDGAGKDTGIMFDDLSIKVFKGLTYEDWAEDEGLTEGVNDARADNPDLDSMDNLLEYSLGGNPLVDDDASILPFTDSTVVDTLLYIYNRRIDYALRGLDYSVILTIDDLTLGTWTNYGAAFESGSVLINSEFEAVTNALPIDGVPMGFLNLEVTEQ